MLGWFQLLKFPLADRAVQLGIERMGFAVGVVKLGVQPVHGAPPRKYTIIGVAEAEVGEGWGDNDILRSAVASEVKKQGGHAAIQMAAESSFGGVMPIGGDDVRLEQ